MRFRMIAAIVAATTLLCAPLAAQDRKLSALPNAAALSGADYLPGIQGAGCSSGVAPCGNVRVQLAQVIAYLTPTFEARDADLDAIAALTTTTIGRSLLTQADAAALRSVLGVTATGADTTYLYRANNLSGLTDASAARGNLGLGSIATQAASAVAITGGTISGLASALPIASGGTGGATVAAARSSLGLGTAATANIGTSGATVPLLNSANAWDAQQTFRAASSALFLPIADFTSGTSANQVVIGESSNNSGYRLNIGYYYNSGTWTGVLNVLAAGSPSTLVVNPSGGAVVVVGPLLLKNVPVYASDAAAGSGGLTSGAVYKASDGNGGYTLKIKS